MAKIRFVVGSVWAGVFALLLSAGLLPLATADVFIPDPPDTKRVPVTIELDWGPFAERVSARHRVARSETLRSIAEHHYGDAAQWKRIAEANPGEVKEPDRIRAGSVLWIPPASDSTEGEPGTVAATLAPRYEAFWMEGVGYRGYQVAERAGLGRLSKRFRQGGRLLMLPLADAVPVIAALGEKKHRSDQELPSSALYASLFPGNLRQADDATVRIIGRYRLDFIQQQLIQTVLTVLEFDKEDRRLGLDAPDVGGDVPGAALGPIPVIGWDLPGPGPDQPPSGDGDARTWDRTTGVLVALGGLALIVGVALLRRRYGSDSTSHDG